jgi:hypothetical protein
MASRYSFFYNCPSVDDFLLCAGRKQIQVMSKFMLYLKTLAFSDESNEVRLVFMMHEVGSLLGCGSFMLDQLEADVEVTSCPYFNMSGKTVEFFSLTSCPSPMHHFPSLLHLLLIAFVALYRVCIATASARHHLRIVACAPPSHRFVSPSHRPCVALASLLHCMCIAFVSPLHCSFICIALYRICIAFASRLHRVCIAIVSPLHRHCMAIASPGHMRLRIAYASLLYAFVSPFSTSAISQRFRSDRTEIPQRLHRDSGCDCVSIPQRFRSDFAAIQ